MSLTDTDMERIEELFDLQWFDSANFKGYVITRVPGGWLFSTPRGVAFVPLNDETAMDFLRHKESFSE